MNNQRLNGWRPFRVAEALLWVGGALLLCLYLGAKAHALLLSDADTRRFLSARSAAGLPVDQSRWSESRKSAYAASRLELLGLPEALLAIPQLDLTVPVWQGVDEVTLNRGVGRVPTSAEPGEPGNVALAGHRDGFFRQLGQLEIGDRIEVMTLDDKHVYLVSETMIVEPNDTSVLEDNGTDTLTLITCYPFYYIGPAPQRFIIRAALTGNH